MIKDSEYIEYIVKGLVDHPEDVKIDRKVDEMGVLISIDVHREDMGKVIGKQGITAKAIRTLLRVIGMKNNSRVNMKINEPKEMIGDQSNQEYKSHLDDVDAVMDGIKNI